MHPRLWPTLSNNVNGLDVVGAECLQAVRTLARARLDTFGYAFLTKDVAAGLDHGVFQVLVTRAAVRDTLFVTH